MFITLFNKKKPDRIRYIKRNNIRKPDLDPSKIGDIINKPIHLKIRKKELLKEKKSLLQRFKNIKIKKYNKKEL